MARVTGIVDQGANGQRRVGSGRKYRVTCPRFRSRNRQVEEAADVHIGGGGREGLSGWPQDTAICTQTGNTVGQDGVRNVAGRPLAGGVSGCCGVITAAPSPTPDTKMPTPSASHRQSCPQTPPRFRGNRDGLGGREAGAGGVTRAARPAGARLAKSRSLSPGDWTSQSR